MNRERPPLEQHLVAPAPECRDLSDAELEGVDAGTGGLVHEPTHAGSGTPPRTGGSGTVQVPSVRPPRSPPTGMP